MRCIVLAAFAALCGIASASPLDLSAYQNKVVLIDFWASWCTPCKSSFPWLNALQQKYGPEQLAVVTINLDEHRHDAEAFLKTLQSSLPVIYDPNGDIAKHYGLVAMPTSVLIDRHGKVRFHHHGFLEAKTSDYENHLRSLLLE